MSKAGASYVDRLQHPLDAPVQQDVRVAQVGDRAPVGAGAVLHHLDQRPVQLRLLVAQLVAQRRIGAQLVLPFDRDLGGDRVGRVVVGAVEGRLRGGDVRLLPHAHTGHQRADPDHDHGDHEADPREAANPERRGHLTPRAACRSGCSRALSARAARG
ncbi:hypothetical protein GCM10009557_55590 [Virgisporangium ochraceum]